MKTNLGESRTGRDKGSAVRLVSSKTDIISRKGGFIDAIPYRSYHAPTAHKGPELRDLPPFRDSIPGTGIVWAIIFSTLIWLAVLFLFALPSYGQPIHVVHARGTLGASEIQARDIFETTRYMWLREIGESLEVKSWVSRRNPFQRFHRSLGGRSSLLWAWQEFGRRTKKKPLIALVPPFNQDGLYYMAGFAVRGGSAGYATSEMKNQYGADRSIHSAVTALHEIGHIFCAEHDNKSPVSIMNADVIPYSSLELKFSDRSKKQIRECR